VVKFILVATFVSVQVSFKFLGLFPHVACDFMQPGVIQMLGGDVQMFEPFSLVMPFAIGSLMLTALLMLAIPPRPISLGKLSKLLFGAHHLLTHLIDSFTLSMFVLQSRVCVPQFLQTLT
jgi:hypothetical protein